MIFKNATPEVLTGHLWHTANSKFLAIVLVTATLGITGCKTTGSTPDEVTYNLFFSPGDHVEELLADKKVLEASKIYNDQPEFFEEDSKSRRTLSGQLWTALTARLSPQLTKFSAELYDTNWPVPSTKWSKIKRLIENSDALIERINGHSVITNGRFKYPAFTNYIEQVRTAKSAIMEDAPKQFQAYELSTSPNFFTQYPVDIAVADFLKKITLDFEKRLVHANVAGIRHVYETYGKELPKTAGEELARIHYQGVLASYVPASFKAPSRGSFQKILKAISETKLAGLPLKSLPGTKVSLVEVTSKTLLQEGQIEFPTAIKMDLPFNAAKHDIDDAFDSETAKNADIMVLFDVNMARTVRDVHSKESVASEFQIGTRKIPNPDYNMAQNAVNAAMMRVQQANMTKMSADSQYCYGMGCLAKAIAQIAAAVGVNEATKEHAGAMETMGATPMQIDEPVYRNYNFSKVTMETAKVATVNYYVIDRLGKVYFKDSFDVQDKKEFTVAYKLNKRDRNMETNLAGTQTEKEVSEFEARPVTVKLSSILEQFTAKSAKHQSLPSLKTIRTEVLKDKNSALSAYRDRSYEIKPNRDDGRFNSVVVILNPNGGLGSGFYIRDDLVLTNFHVIDGSKFIEMKLFNGQETFGKVIAKDIRLDLAVVRVQQRGAAARFYSGKSLAQGTSVDLIGHPNRLQFSITRGIISAERRTPSMHMQGGKPVHVIQTDAAINGGNSGGPMFMGNEIVGVNTFKLVGKSIEGLNFAIHYSEVFEFLKRKGININKGS
jgi:serine protease Do